ncbi:hypothetical protein [Persephonella sp.]
MKTLNIKLKNEVYEKIKMISKNKKIPIDKLLSDLIETAVEEKLLLEKAKEIIEEEKNLLKRLA